jgi:hypothetical protein
MNNSFESPEVNNRLWRTFEERSQRTLVIDQLQYLSHIPEEPLPR